MKKIDLLQKLRDGWKLLIRSVCQHPAELVMLVYAAIVLGINKNLYGTSWMCPCILAPFLVTAAYTLSFYRQKSKLWNLLYFVPLLLAITSFVTPPLAQVLLEWSLSISYWVLMVVAALWLFIRHFKMENIAYVQRNILMVNSGVMAAFVAGILYLLYILIQVSIEMIFGWDFHDELMEKVAYIVFVVILPMLFFALEDEERVFSLERFWKNVLLWVLTPALLIYTAILYIYSAKVLFTWTLPEGSVSVMIFIFCLTAMGAQMLLQFCDKNPFGWFYRHFSWFALPLLVLFWVGVARRISDYGLTENRYYLILCGLLMTAYVVLFLFENKKGYFILTCAAAAIALASVCIPPLSAKQVSLKSQIARVQKTAASIGLLAPNGKLILNQPDTADITQGKQHRIIYKSLKYIEWTDTTALQQFGVKSAEDYLLSLSYKTVEYSKSYRETDIIYPPSAEKIIYLSKYYDYDHVVDIKPYQHFYPS
ncbi:MAG: DUF4153 domain-containing protein [Bacteroidales bacterium]|nr:DUF4153 domain-containing protein [Bacteroidales bacterium]